MYSQVLTAAHCVNNLWWPEMWFAMVGAHDFRKPGASMQNLKLKRIILYPKHNYKTHEGDIALIELQNPAKLNNEVSLACLPSKIGEQSTIGTECVITGRNFDQP